MGLAGRIRRISGSADDRVLPATQESYRLALLLAGHGGAVTRAYK
jgi:hypothetical protein